MILFCVWVIKKAETGGIRGTAGFSVLKRIITKMPEESTVDIVPYYGEPGGEIRLEYPFDTFELYKHTEKYSVFFGIPGSA